MVLGLLAVEAVGDVPVIVPVQGGGGGDRQGNPLVGRAEEGGGVLREVLLKAGGVVVPQPGGLGAGLIVAGVDEVRGLPAGFRDEVPEGQHAGAHHKGDEFLLIGHRDCPPVLSCLILHYIISEGKCLSLPAFES